MSEYKDEWYLIVRGNRIGPLGIDSLSGMIQQKKVPANSFVWREGLERWIEANKLPEFGLMPIASDPSAPSPTPTPPPLPPSVPISSISISPTPTFVVENTQETYGAAPALSTPTGGPMAIAAKVSQIVGDATWMALIASGLKPETVVACIPVFRLKMNEELNESAAANAISLLRRVSNTISDMTDRGDVMWQNHLVDCGPNQVFITSRIGATPEVFSIPRSALYVSNRWENETLELELRVDDSSTKVKSLICRFHAGEPISEGFAGSVLPLIMNAAKGAPGIGSGALPTLFRSRVALGQRNVFKTSFPTQVNISFVELQDSGLRVCRSGITESIPLTDILAWQVSEYSVAILTYKSNLIRRWVIAIPGRFDPSESAEEKNSVNESQASVSTGLENANNQQSSNDSELADTPSVEFLREQRNYNLAEAAKSLNAIVDFLQLHRPESRAQFEMLATELDATSLLKNEPTQLLLRLRDTECSVALKKGSVGELQWVSRSRLYAFGNLHFLQLSAETVYRIRITANEQALVEAMALAIAESATLDNSVVLLSHPNVPNPTDSQTIPWTQFSLFLLKFSSGMIRFSKLDTQNPQSAILETHIDKLGSRGHIWKDTFGIVSATIEGETTGRLLLASNRTLIQLWEQSELRALAKRTTGVPLGKLYQEYNRSMCEKFLAGVFGNFFIAQQQLEQMSTLKSLMQEIHSAPPGPLPSELNDRLIQRLSILELSRHQLSRWLDRCVLMYPHFMAQAEREWLATGFGEQIVGRAMQDREAWRVHQELRGELRQVQASMGKALAEVGQNLHAISWAFPDEVKFAALAGMRRSAGLAEKGAMLAAFGGIGGELLLGLGRASIGDPLGFAMVGALGLSLVGKHLDKNIKEKEKQIRLRAYGVQALKWWDTTLETAAVMAMECRNSMELSRQTAMLRDRQLLEKLPSDELSKTQSRLAAIMKRALLEDVSSQFYEAVPGSGLFGWHLVDQITKIAIERSRLALTRFQNELPGAMADSDQHITVAQDISNK